MLLKEKLGDIHVPRHVLSCWIGKPRLFSTKCNNHLRVVTQSMHHVNDSDLFHSLFLQNKQSEGAERGRLREVNPLSFDSRANKNWLQHLNCRHALIKIAAPELIVQRELEFKTDFNQCHIAAHLKDNYKFFQPVPFSIKLTVIALLARLDLLLVSASLICFVLQCR